MLAIRDEESPAGTVWRCEEIEVTNLTAREQGETPAGDSAVVAPADAAEQRLHSFFRQFEGRSLADELIAERREEARGESS